MPDTCVIAVELRMLTATAASTELDALAPFVVAFDVTVEVACSETAPDARIDAASSRAILAVECALVYATASSESGVMSSDAVAFQSMLCAETWCPSRVISASAFAVESVSIDGSVLSGPPDSASMAFIVNATFGIGTSLVELLTVLASISSEVRPAIVIEWLSIEDDVAEIVVPSELSVTSPPASLTVTLEALSLIGAMPAYCSPTPLTTSVPE